VGSLMTLPAFTSVSLDDKVANGFGDHVLFQFTRVRGVRIRALSQVPEEAEVLVPPPSVYRIVAAAMFHGSLVVTLERVDSPLTYLASPPALLAPSAGGAAAAPPPPTPASAALSPSSASSALDPEVEALADSLVALKVGLKKACVTFAEALCQEGVMSIQDLAFLPEATARQCLAGAGLKELQQMKVMQAVPRAPAPAPPPVPATAPAPAPAPPPAKAAAAPPPAKAAAAPPSPQQQVQPTSLPQFPPPTIQTSYPQTLNPDPKPQNPNPKPQTPNPKPQTPKPKPQTSNPKPQTPNPKPQTPNPKPQPPNPKSPTPNPPTPT